MGLLSWIVGLLGKVLQAAQGSGVTNEHLMLIKPLVQEAFLRFTDNAARREWVVQQVVERFNLPESAARWAVESVLLLIKRKLTT